MDARGKAEEGLEGGHRRSAAVEAEGELIKVGLEVVVPDAVVGAAQPGLEVAKDAMDVRQELGGPFGRALGTGAMAVAQLGEGGIRLPAVRQDEGAGGDGAFHEAHQRARRGIRDHVEPHPAGRLPPNFHRADDQRLVQELAAALETGLVTPQIGLIDLDLLLQRLPLGVDHGPTKLVQERPGRLVADPELAPQLHRRQPGGMGGHQVGGPEPDRQRHPRPMQDRARRHRDLPATRLALPQPPVRQLEGCPRPAVRTAKPVGPSARGQVLPAPVLIPESRLEFLQGLGEIRPAHPTTLRMGAFGVNPIGRRLVTDIQEDIFADLDIRFLSLWGRPLQLIDCQNLFCEADKYLRVVLPTAQGLSGRTRIKQTFRQTMGGLPYWYPPKWGLNDLVHQTSNAGSLDGLATTMKTSIRGG